MSNSIPPPGSDPREGLPPPAEAYPPGPPAAYPGGEGPAVPPEAYPLLPWDRPGPPHPGFFASFLWCLFFLLATQIPGALLAIVLILGMALLAPQTVQPGADAAALMQGGGMSATMAITMLVTQLLVLGVSLLVLRVVVGRDWPRQVALRRCSAGHLLLVLLGFPAMVVLGNVAYAVLKHLVPSITDLGLPGMEEMVKVFNSWPWPFAVLVIGLGPGVGEELWCRGFLGRGLVGRYGVVLGVLFTSFFFGLIHVDPRQGTMAMLVGLWLHFVYLTTRSLWAPILLHTLNNSLAVVASRHPTLEALEGTAQASQALLAGLSVLLLAVTGVALYRSRARVVAAEGDGGEWRPEWPGVEYPPPGSQAGVHRPAPSPLLTLLSLASLAGLLAALLRG